MNVNRYNTLPASPFRGYVLQISDGIEDIGGVRTELIITLFVAWIIIFCCLFKGVESSGKVSDASPRSHTGEGRNTRNPWTVKHCKGASPVSILGLEYVLPPTKFPSESLRNCRELMHVVSLEPKTRSYFTSESVKSVKAICYLPSAIMFESYKHADIAF